MIRDNQKGQLFIEVLLAVALASLLVVAGVGVVSPSVRISTLSQDNEGASWLIQQQFEIIRSIRNEDWNSIGTNGTYSVADIPDLQLQNGPRTYDKFTISIIISDVFRDVNDNIVTTGGVFDDQTKEIMVRAEWDWLGEPKTEEQIVYLTNWGGF